MVATRYAAALVLAGLVTFGLFWVMQALIGAPDPETTPNSKES